PRPTQSTDLPSPQRANLHCSARDKDSRNPPYPSDRVRAPWRISRSPAWSRSQAWVSRTCPWQKQQKAGQKRRSAQSGCGAASSFLSENSDFAEHYGAKRSIELGGDQGDGRFTTGGGGSKHG